MSSNGHGHTVSLFLEDFMCPRYIIIMIIIIKLVDDFLFMSSSSFNSTNSMNALPIVMRF